MKTQKEREIEEKFARETGQTIAEADKAASRMLGILIGVMLGVIIGSVLLWGADLLG